MKKRKIFCGIDYEKECGFERHPLNEVKRAIQIIKSDLPYTVHYSNNPDFVSAMFHIGNDKGIELEFVLNGVSKGNEIDEIFQDFNRSLDLINEITENFKD